MKRKASPTLIGAFVVGGLLLLALAIIVTAGNRLFSRKERVVMYFSGSVYGLREGAPVVFRGVRVGSVSSISVAYAASSDNYLIPVLAELDGDVVRGIDGDRAGEAPGPPLQALVKRGLSAQLSMQSLLTGLLYVDLDLRQPTPALPADPVLPPRPLASDPELVEIPTRSTTIQALKNQLDGMDFRRLADDVAAIAASSRTVLAGPALKQALDNMAQISINLNHLTQRLDHRIDPLADDLQRSMASLRGALESMEAAASGVKTTARRVGDTSERIGVLLAPESTLVLDLQRIASELSRTAQALQQSTAGDAGLPRQAERTLQDVARAARALRELANTVAEEPESLLRGRQESR